MSTGDTVEERKAHILMRLRGYKLVKKRAEKDGSSFLAKTAEGKKMLIFCRPTQGTVGVQVISQVRKVMKEEKADNGIIVTSGRFTQAAKVQAKRRVKKGEEERREIELIPRLFPSFNIFEHVFVPKHEIVSGEEREKLLKEYKVQPYQLPRLMDTDPGAKAIGARPGDIVRITRDSPTAGKYTSYRYVVEG